eukprot:1711587-Prymnesium_polylepis.1
MDGSSFLDQWSSTLRANHTGGNTNTATSGVVVCEQVTVLACDVCYHTVVIYYWRPGDQLATWRPAGDHLLATWRPAGDQRWP